VDLLRKSPVGGTGGIGGHSEASWRENAAKREKQMIITGDLQEIVATKEKRETVGFLWMRKINSIV